jgi:phenylacetate-CoA ligase
MTRLVYSLRDLYDKSPDAIRHSVGEVVGRIPARWRYGAAFANTWDLLHSWQAWSQKKRDEYHLRSLRELLIYAGQHVPYYRRLFKQLDFRPEGVCSVDDLSRLPLLTRPMVRELGKDLLAEVLSEKSYKYSTTAGTSGKPLGFYVTYDASAAEWAFMLTNWQQAGFRLGDKRVVLRGRLIGGRQVGRLWEYDPVSQALYFSSFDLSKANLGRFVRLMKEYRPEFLHAYPSSATILGQYLEESGERLPGLRGLLLGSENLYPAQKTYLEKVFGLPTFSWYGQSEKCILAGGCTHSDGYHVFPAYGVTELVDFEGQPIRSPGRRGVLVGTGFINRATVLIRYQTDDEAEWTAGTCGCGGQEPRLINVRGHRTQEMLVGRSGALIGMAAINLHSGIYTRIRQFQFFQETPGQAILRIIPVNDYTKQDEDTVLAEFEGRLQGEVTLKIEYLAELPLTASGKFKFIDQRIDIKYPMWN